ncbi:hypothetical protein KKB64_01930 [Patescibacteria group bacterium]|nr:hypothetical protein [Patescibacteria group bacterium]MBU1472531.1 hypothetical protein [Patescibacteria group bacterium]MBU2460096.1 hypothetical protein [Patescibacteria group bacterium]MBU2544665.1 hypothetical protein [Patescibacteria group bacterium]
MKSTIKPATRSTIRLVKNKATKDKDTVLPLPSEESIAKISGLLVAQFAKEEQNTKYASTKKVLSILGAGTVLGLCLISPTAILLAKPFIDLQKEKERVERCKSWKRYNPCYLRRAVKRLQTQKLVAIGEENGEQIVKLTEGGRRRILRYALDELSITKPKKWDGLWRLITYDIIEGKHNWRDTFRNTLKSMGFLRLQHSVWLYPYPCEAQVTFLREYFGVGNEVLYIVAKNLEKDLPYKEYFGLD